MQVLRRPRWLVGTIIAVLVVVLFVNLGFWQLRRLDERRDRNDAIEERSSLPGVPVDEVVDARAGFDDVAGLVYRRGSGPGGGGPPRGGRHPPPAPDGGPRGGGGMPVPAGDGTRSGG